MPRGPCLHGQQKQLRTRQPHGLLRHWRLHGLTKSQRRALRRLAAAWTTAVMAMQTAALTPLKTGMPLSPARQGSTVRRCPMPMPGMAAALLLMPQHGGNAAPAHLQLVGTAGLQAVLLQATP